MVMTNFFPQTFKNASLGWHSEPEKDSKELENYFKVYFDFFKDHSLETEALILVYKMHSF